MPNAYRSTNANRSGNSASSHAFSQIPRADIMRSVFDRSSGLKTTFDEGLLIPIFLDEALPGDTFSMSVTSFARMSTPLHPIMDNLFMDFFWFFVPNRLIWENWEKMNGQQTNPGDSTSFLVPQMVAPVAPGYQESSLADYFGLPTEKAGYSHSSLWHRAYNLIWNEWFRDQNLQNSVVVDLDDGPDAVADYVLLRRGKRHDYFTSCLPFPQKGTAVSLPLGTSAPLLMTGNKQPTFKMTGGSVVVSLGGTNASTATRWGADPAQTNLAEWVDPKLTVDLSAATAATINQLREAFQIQRMFERDARGGTRYTEILRSHFGVVSPDQRLQRPEFLGGGSAMININPVAQTFPDSLSGTHTGDLGAFVTSAAYGNGFTKSFTEHGVILGLVCVRADLTYQQGLERQFSRRTRFDFYWPSLAHLGEQAVLNKEIWMSAEPAGIATNAATFGYQERFAEYRYKPSKITGLFRSDAALSLDTWHLGIDFATLPALNATFIQEDAPVERVIAVVTEPHFIADFWFKYRCARPMPVFSVPGLIDHF